MNKRPSIAIDTSYMDRRPGKGTAIVIRHTVEELLAYRDQFDITLIHKTSVPEDSLYKEFREIVIPRIPLPKWSGFFSELWFFLTTKERFDVYYFSYSRIYPTFWLAPAKRIIFAIMDGGPATANYRQKIKGTQPFSIRAFFWKVSAFIALSKFGKEGIISAYGLPEEKVHIVYNGLDERFMSPVVNEGVRKRLEEVYKIAPPYILCVSRFDPHKNILRLLEAYKECVNADPQIEKLVFVGGRHMADYSKLVDEKIKELGLSERIHITQYISDEDLPAVYALASLMVFPSMYEGFGLPVVEAMATGIPLVLSDIAALQEVSGGYAEFVDPYSVHSIANGIQKVRTNPEAAQQRVDEGKVWVRRFTWKAHGEALVRVLESVVKNP